MSSWQQRRELCSHFLVSTTTYLTHKLIKSPKPGWGLHSFAHHWSGKSTKPLARAAPSHSRLTLQHSYPKHKRWSQSHRSILVSLRRCSQGKTSFTLILFGLCLSPHKWDWISLSKSVGFATQSQKAGEMKQCKVQQFLGSCMMFLTSSLQVAVVTAVECAPSHFVKCFFTMHDH